MATPNRKIRFTYNDYRSLPESMTGRYELLDGDIVMVPAPTTVHQRVCRNLGFLLTQFTREHALGEVLFAPIDVVLGEGSSQDVVEPDIVFIAGARANIVTEKEIVGPPDLVVEVVSPGTEDRDRGYKKALYARHGVAEYWIVDPQEEILEVHRPGESGFVLAGRYPRNQAFISALFPGLAIALEEVFVA